MKLLVTADLHYNLKQFDWLLGQVSKVDAMILAGDFLDLASYVTPDVQSQVVEKYLLKMRSGARVIASSGNHDADRDAPDAEYATQWLQYLRQDGIEVDGDTIHFGEILVSICPWWLHEAQRDRLRERLLRDRKLSRSLWIWIHHVPTDQTAVSWTGKAFKGERALNSWIEEMQPDIVFSGHIHGAPFHPGGSWHVRQGKTLVLNAGHELGSVPPHLRVDLESRQVEWFSSADRDSCQF